MRRSNSTIVLPWPPFVRGSFEAQMASQLQGYRRGDKKMLHYALVFFLIAVVAAIFCFGGNPGASAGSAQNFFFLFFVFFFLPLVGVHHPTGGRRTKPFVSSSTA